MIQNTLAQSVTSLEHGTNAHCKLNQGLSQPRSPFVVSRVDNQTVTKHEVSKSAHWSNAEKERYSLFVCYFRQLLDEDKSCINNWNLFKGMAKFVKTRNPQQCRSHHLKLTKEFRGISKFILMVLERIPKLKERILLTECELSQIQIQFNLYLPEEKISNLCSIPENRLFDQEQEPKLTTGRNISSKDEKQEFIKTADSYIQQQHPVKQNKNIFSIFSSRSQFKPFDHFSSKPNRSSLPSFGDDDNPSHQIKQEYQPSENLPNQLQQFPSFPPQSNSLASSENFNVFSSDFDRLKNQDKGMEKMKEFLECHYLFQLWTSKLEKIMRNS